MVLPKPTRFTEDEYYALEAASQTKHEFVNGHIYAMTGGSPSHNTISTNLVGQLFGALRGGPCRVFSTDMAIKTLETGSVFYPDVTVVCGEPVYVPPLSIAKLENPTIIFEVLSPSTAPYDRTTKFYNYAQIPSLKQYVLVEQDQPLIHVINRNDANEWDAIHPLDGIDAELTLPAVNVTLAFNDIYEQVAFNDPPHVE